MNITLRKGNLEEQECDLLIVNEFAKWTKFGGATKAVDDKFDERLSKIAKEEGFKAGRSETLLVRTFDGFPAKRILLVGLGDQKEFSSQVVREVSATAYQAAKNLRANKIVSILHGAGFGSLPAMECGRAQMEGLRLGAYEFVKLKKTPEEKPHEVKSWEIVTSNGNHARLAKRGMELGEIVAQGTIFARDLVNEPAMEMTPKNLTRVAEAVAKNSGGSVKVKLLMRDEMKKLGMGGVLGVAQGSDHGPVFVHMEYKAPKARKRVSIVGKAVTFDSGGLSLKPAEYMTHMKCDMAGAAAVLGIFSVLAELKPRVHVDGIFAAVENMPSGTAIRPGDVLKAMNGKTMEVLNTDAEGRLTLADALSYASTLKPHYLVDLATLTGACMAALGEEISGLMGNDPDFNTKLMTTATQAGESLWSLPLEKRYRRLIDSKVADLQNVGGKYGGAITAGLFLQEFVSEGISWAHIDIAGPAFAQTPMNPYTQYGGTGAGVATMIEFLRSI
ncbi:hypothetical protein A3D69_01980 [Candidatus Uhrbacteria bacterium RIFCSPHIGHO2_02_FULL_54_11]|nr:MAG: hypothetical protein A3D69_01980 [Candidatus Uhrbacteria bacterium RIFCSPHIGHO2_02_FULL_54_11]